MSDLKPKDFCWTWAENVDWPVFWRDEAEAKEHAEKLARENPGVKVYVGTLTPDATMVLPDTLKIKES